MVGEQVTLEDMLLCREARQYRQRALLERHGKPLLSFTMNVPGPVKTYAELRRAFDEGLSAIRSTLGELGIPVLEKIEVHEKTGDEALLCFDGDAGTVKARVTAIEESHPLGRLFDMDVLDETGRKLSRPGYRSCLLCGEQAQVCARSRRHTVAEMQAKIDGMLEAHFHSGQTD